MKAYRAIVAAMKIIEGKHAEQYSRLWDFVEEIKKTNPGSTVKIKLDELRFQMMYVCLGACKEGFKHGCRALIGLDSYHLKSQQGGQLLVAVGIDPNDKTWVIAYAVVEMKNKNSWIWFLEILVEDIGIINQHRWTFISDKQKGLIPAFLAILPDYHHSHAITVINYKKDKLEYYVDVCYSNVIYLETYGHLIQPMNGMSMWKVTENPLIQPPLYTRQHGRLKKKRNKEAAENEKEANPSQNEATNRSGDIPQPQ
ncbi:uncharacterized protein [Pyrus communis]|uniref:uncharacterized protein n=1 Tax=Pyrus communis TaxID=23211 RepID=UPI0035BFE519